MVPLWRGDAHMSNDANFGELRSLAQREGTSKNWERLCDELERWPARYISEALVPYLEPSLARWPAHTRTAPYDWLRPLSRGAHAHPAWGLVRRVDAKALGACSARGAASLGRREELGVLSHIQVPGGRDSGAVFLWNALEARKLENLRALEVTGWGLDTWRLIDGLVKSNFTKLRVLSLNGVGLGQLELDRLLRAPWSVHLHRLSLRDNLLTSRTETQLLEYRLPELERLELDGNRLTTNALERIKTRCTSAHVRAVASSPRTPH